jgi:hypothetical protein
VITENPDIGPDALRDVIERNWHVTVTDLSFLPVGGDSWSYRAGDLFVNAREALGQRKPWSFPRDVEPSLVAAVALKERCGLEFMLTPLPTATGRPLARLHESHGDSLRRGPRERDLHDFRSEDRGTLADDAVVTYYKRDFALSEVAEYADRLSRTHPGDEEDDRAWDQLGQYIEELWSFCLR